MKRYWRGLLFLSAFFALCPAVCPAVLADEVVVTAQGKDQTIAELNARVAAVRQYLHEMVPMDFLVENVQTIRESFILKSQDFTSAVRITSSTVENGIHRIEASVEVDAVKMKARLEQLFPEKFLAAATPDSQPGIGGGLAEKSPGAPDAAKPADDKPLADAEKPAEPAPPAGTAPPPALDGETGKAPEQDAPEVNPPVAAKSLSDESFLQLFAGGGDAEKILGAIANGANVNASGAAGDTPLILAARGFDNPELLKALLDAGADVRARNKKGHDALREAIANGANKTRLPEMMDALLARGPELDAGNESILMFLMHKYTGKQVAEAASRLLAAGAAVNAQDNIGFTALIISLGNNDLELMDLLLKNGADPNIEMKELRLSALTFEIDGACRPEIIRTLLEHGANANLAASDGLRPLHHVAQRDKIAPEVPDMLIKAGADINAQAADTGMTPLMLAVAKGNVRTAETLLDAGADASLKDNSGRTASQLLENWRGKTQDAAAFDHLEKRLSEE